MAPKSKSFSDFWDGIGELILRQSGRGRSMVQGWIPTGVELVSLSADGTSVEARRESAAKHDPCCFGCKEGHHHHDHHHHHHHCKWNTHSHTNIIPTTTKTTNKNKYKYKNKQIQIQKHTKTNTQTNTKAKTNAKTKKKLWTSNYGLVPGSIAGFAKPREITTWIHGGWSSKQMSFQFIPILFLKDRNLWCPLVLATAATSESCHPPIMKVASHLSSTELDRMAVLASASTRSNFRIKEAFWRISSGNRAGNKQDQNPHVE